MRDILSQVSHRIVSSNNFDIEKTRQKLATFHQHCQMKSKKMENLQNFNVDEIHSVNETLNDVLLRQTLTALRIFVNDEINELDFAIRHVASEFLKPKIGKVIVIINTVSFYEILHIPYPPCDFGKFFYHERQLGHSPKFYLYLLLTDRCWIYILDG